jgi:hypothetical protein
MNNLKELSYMIGVIQGDGCLYEYSTKYKGRNENRVILKLNAKDLEMVMKVRDIFDKKFKRKNRICKNANGMYDFHSRVKTLLEQLHDLSINFKNDPPIPPTFVRNDIKLFGPYLAGLIDSDGDVRIKRPKYPQCAVRINSGHPQTELKKYIEKNLNCKANISEMKTWNNRWKRWNHEFRLEFLISSRNFKIFRKFILPFIQIPRKKMKIKEYLNKFNCKKFN